MHGESVYLGIKKWREKKKQVNPEPSSMIGENEVKKQLEMLKPKKNFDCIARIWSYLTTRMTRLQSRIQEIPENKFSNWVVHEYETAASKDRKFTSSMTPFCLARAMWYLLLALPGVLINCDQSEAPSPNTNLRGALNPIFHFLCDSEQN